MPASAPPTSAVLLKVNALIDKALSTHSVEEARTCALTAAKMLRQYDLKLSGADDEVSTQVDARAVAAAVLVEVKRATRLIRERLDAAEARAASAEAKVKRLEAEKQHLEHAEHVKDLAGRWMRSRFSQSCRKCGLNQKSGEKVWWLGAKKGVLCADCWWKKQYQRAM